MTAILNSKMADSRNLYFVLIHLIYLMPNMILFLCFVLRKAIFISEFIIWENECLLRMSILTLFIKVMIFRRLLCCALEIALMQKMA